jgi:hypothetical protein
VLKKINRKTKPDLCIKIEKIIKKNDKVFLLSIKIKARKTKDMQIPCLIAFDVDMIIGQVCIAKK